MKKTRGPDHIREHLEKAGHRHQYMNYAQGLITTNCHIGRSCRYQESRRIHYGFRCTLSHSLPYFMKKYLKNGTQVFII
jgi:hypothetical protein